MADVDVELTVDNDEIKRTEKNCDVQGTAYAW